MLLYMCGWKQLKRFTWSKKLVKLSLEKRTTAHAAQGRNATRVDVAGGEPDFLEWGIVGRGAGADHTVVQGCWWVTRVEVEDERHLLFLILRR